MSVVDLVKNLVSDEPGAPQFAQPFTGVSVGLRDFGDDVGGEKFDAITVTIETGMKIQTPANGLLRYVPNLVTLAADKRRAFADRWPDLRRLDGRAFDAAAQSEGDLLLEIWPTAFRRMEGMFASVEMPIPGADLTRPQTPVPRWFIFKGIAKAELETHVQAIADAQFLEGPSPDITRFFTGEIPVYTPYKSTLAEGIGGDVDIRAFDSSGLVVDPAVFCGYLAALADPDSELFAAFAAPGTTPFLSFPQRHTIVFSDARGGAYAPFADLEPLADAPEPRAWFAPVDPPADAPARVFADLLTPTLVRYREDFPNWRALRNSLVTITLEGEHVRVGLHPHGTHDRSIIAAFGDWTFLRVRVTDFARWFPKNANTLARYTEQNDLVALVDGQSMFRETYRAFRSTFVDETYASDDAMPPGTRRAALEAGASQIFMTNFSIAPENPLLGMRAMLTTSRTQPGAVVPENPLAGARPIPRALTVEGEQHEWWLVSPRGALPPGSSVELQPVGVDASFSGDDPRLPGTDSGADLYGITIHSDDVARVFANADGQFFIPVNFAPEWGRKAELRVITWEPADDDPEPPLATTTSGKGKKKIHARGKIDVAAPASLTIHAVGSPWNATATFSLVAGDTTGNAQLTIGANSLSADARVVVVVNQRTGDTRFANVAASATDEVTIQLTSFSVNDIALVSTLPDGNDDPASVPYFFAVTVSDATRAAGAIPAHPKELLGVLREAIDAGVKVRLLAYRDQLHSPEEYLKNYLGMAAALNAAGIGLKRGEAIADPVLRETSSHHQKTAFIRSPAGIVAFVGGIDEVPTRWATSDHSPVEPDRPETTQWHDIHCLVRGKAAWDVFHNFRQRWNIASIDPRVTGEGIPFTPVDLFDTADLDDPSITPNTGTHAVQINRTLPSRVAEYASIVNTSFGDQSILTSYIRMIETARDFLYIEDQYFYNIDLAHRINARLRLVDGLKFVILVLPKELSEDPAVDLMLYAIRVRAINMLLYGKQLLAADEDGTALAEYVGDRVLIVHLVNEQGKPVYVHCKTIIADDVWMSIGSSNINHRSMTYDTELNAASIDSRITRGGHVSARELRVRLMAEHLGLDIKERSLIEYPRDAFRVMKEVLAGEHPWLKDHLIRYDPVFTHFGLQPAEYNEVLLDALNLLIDPDGLRLDVGIDLLSIRALLDHLKAADEGQAITFGGIGTIRVAFNTRRLSSVSAPAAIFVEISEVDPHDLPAFPVRRGPFGPTDQPILGIFRIGRNYTLSAEAFDAAITLIGSASSGEVSAANFVTDVTLIF
jgi:phosphatidylserine/phosphatidylglycerophosphate/cardiolipin synthase-like enzyme